MRKFSKLLVPWVLVRKYQIEEYFLFFSFLVKKENIAYVSISEKSCSHLVGVSMIRTGSFLLLVVFPAKQIIIIINII